MVDMSGLSENIRKAAILVSALDHHSADAMLAQLDADEADRVRQTVMALGDIDPAEQQAVLEEFLGAGADGEAENTDVGVELDAGLAERLAESQPSGSQSDSSNTGPPVAFWQDADAQALAGLLASEHPQTVAVVLSRMPHDQAAQLLTRLDEETQVEAVRRLANLDELDADCLREIEQVIESWVCEHARMNERRQAGAAAVAGILGSIDRDRQEQLMQRLRQSDQRLASRLSGESAGQGSGVKVPAVESNEEVAGAERRELPVVNDLGAHFDRPQPSKSGFEAAFDECSHEPRDARTWTFDSLEELSGSELLTVFSHARPEVAMLALAGASPSLAERLMAQFDPRQAAELQRALLELGPTRLSDVAAAQAEIAQLAMDLQSHGNIAPPRARLSMAA